MGTVVHAASDKQNAVSIEKVAIFFIVILFQSKINVHILANPAALQNQPRSMRITCGKPSKTPSSLIFSKAFLIAASVVACVMRITDT